MEGGAGSGRCRQRLRFPLDLCESPAKRAPSVSPPPPPLPPKAILSLSRAKQPPCPSLLPRFAPSPPAFSVPPWREPRAPAVWRLPVANAVRLAGQSLWHACPGLVRALVGRRDPQEPGAEESEAGRPPPKWVRLGHHCALPPRGSWQPRWFQHWGLSSATPPYPRHTHFLSSPSTRRSGACRPHPPARRPPRSPGVVLDETREK